MIRSAPSTSTIDQVETNVEIDLPELAGLLDTMLYEDGVPQARRTQAFDAAGLLMREVHQRCGAWDPSLADARLIGDAIDSETKRIIRLWQQGSCVQMPDYHRMLGAIQLLVGYGARMHVCREISAEEMDRLHLRLDPPSATRVVTDGQGRLVYCDRAWATRLGMQPGELRGAHVIEDLVVPRLRERARELRDRVRAGDRAALYEPFSVQGQISRPEIAYRVLRQTIVPGTGGQRATAMGLLY